MSSPRSTDSLAALALLLALTTGCAPRTIELRAEMVTRTAGAGYWVTGTEGFAALTTAQGTLERHDYPRDPGAPAYAYEPFTLPAATPLVADGQTFLFTRHAGVLLWQASQWWRVPVKFPGDGLSHPQINAALLAPDGRIVVQLHSDTLVWATPAELRRGVYHSEKTPGYFPWLGFHDGALHGIGWTRGGNRRAVHRRDAQGQWTEIGILPEDEYHSDYHGMLRLPTGEVAVAGVGGLFVQSPTGFDARREVATLFPGTMAIAGPLLGSPGPGASKPASPGPLTAPAPDAANAPLTLPAPAPAPAPLAPDRAIGRAPPAQVARDPLPPHFQPDHCSIERVLLVDGYSPLLSLTSGRIGFLDLDPPRPRFLPCARAPFVIGVVLLSTGLRAITTDAELLDLRADGCVRVAPPLLGTEALPGSPP